MASPPRDRRSRTRPRARRGRRRRRRAPSPSGRRRRSRPSPGGRGPWRSSSGTVKPATSERTSPRRDSASTLARLPSGTRRFASPLRTFTVIGAAIAARGDSRALPRSTSTSTAPVNPSRSTSPPDARTRAPPDSPPASTAPFWVSISTEPSTRSRGDAVVRARRDEAAGDVLGRDAPVLGLGPRAAADAGELDAAERGLDVGVSGHVRDARPRSAPARTTRSPATDSALKLPNCCSASIAPVRRALVSPCSTSSFDAPAHARQLDPAVTGRDGRAAADVAHAHVAVPRLDARVAGDPRDGDAVERRVDVRARDAGEVDAPVLVAHGDRGVGRRLDLEVGLEARRPGRGRPRRGSSRRSRTSRRPRAAARCGRRTPSPSPRSGGRRPCAASPGRCPVRRRRRGPRRTRCGPRAARRRPPARSAVCSKVYDGP